MKRTHMKYNLPLVNLPLGNLPLGNLPLGNLLLAINITLLTLCLSACSRKPVLFQNSQLDKTSKQQAQQDIADCMQQAKDAGATSESQFGRSSKDAGIGAASGAAASAIGSAIYNGTVSGRAIGAGAGAGAAGTLVHGLFRKKADPVFENYVNICLEKKGHQPIGWN